MEMEVPAHLQIFADKNMVNTVIRNLLLNAVKFTPRGGQVTITARKADDKVEISVVDNGVGIRPEKLSKLFTIDSNIASQGTAGEEGTGLGLILCKEFIEKNNGIIRVESRELHGSTFTVTLPSFFISN